MRRKGRINAIINHLLEKSCVLKRDEIEVFRSTKIHVYLLVNKHMTSRTMRTAADIPGCFGMKPWDGKIALMFGLDDNMI